jgi:hypothetical protein
MLGEHRLEEVDDRQIEYIEPDHRSVRRIAMVMDCPVWCQHEITRRHVGALALDRRMRTGAIDN